MTPGLHPPQPARHEGGGCHTCARNGLDWIAGGAHVRCMLDPARPVVMANPAAGCAHWLREPGADDEER